MSEVDWIYPPHGVEEETLSGALHDAELYSIVSDRLARTVEFVVDVDHIRRHFGLADSMRFVLKIHDVRSVRALHFEVWPGPAPSGQGLSREEHSRLIDEYRAKWREVSVSWDEIERVVAVEEIALLDADFLRTNDQIALRLEGLAEDGAGEWYQLCVQGRELTVSRTDGEACDLQRLREMGRAYWEAFNSGRPISGE